MRGGLTPLRGLDFHGSPLATFEKDGERWVVMRPVVVGMGLAWQSQNAKLNAGGDRYGVRNDIITRDAGGREQAMTCVPLRRYPMWLATINSAKIPNPAVRQRAEFTSRPSAPSGQHVGPRPTLRA